MRSRRPRTSTGCALLLALLCAALGPAAPSASALTEGVIEGLVTNSSGAPAGGVTVVAFGANHNLRQTTTAADGSYSMNAWPDTYEVVAIPPQAGSEVIGSEENVVLGDGATAEVDLAFTSDRTPARISGNGSYADHSPNAGVEVSIYEAFRNGLVHGKSVYTGENGSWDAGEMPPGVYSVTYVVDISNGAPSQRTRYTVGNEYVVIKAGQTRFVSTTLEGPKPEGMIEATVVSAEGWPANAGVSLRYGDGQVGRYGSGGGKPAVMFAPSGTYTLEVEADSHLMDGDATAQVTTANGHVTRLTIQLPALPLPAGVESPSEQQLLAWLNGQRSRWGLPGGIAGVPLWSRGCAAHNLFGARHDRLEHEEVPDWPGFSPGGHWAGTHAVLSAGSKWGPSKNPFMDAPIHLAQLFTPWLTRVGIDETQGYSCATTWPGMNWSFAPEGTVWTFPGNGTTGLPPVEFASERPTTPNRMLGLPDLTGRQLFVYRHGAHELGGSEVDVLHASLHSPSGPVEVRWLDGNPGFMPPAIIIPIRPLEPFTTYTASVTIAPALDGGGFVQLPGLTHTWSFTTGHDNPSGNWDEGLRKRAINRRAKRRLVRVGYRRGHVIVRGSRFEKGRVVIRRKTLLKRLRRQNGKVLARVQASPKGKFVAKIRWPRQKRLALRVYQRGRSTFGLYQPRTKRRME